MAEAPRVPFRRRSRGVALLKLVLPLLALALMSTVFLLARDGGGPTALPYAELEARAREPRLEGPRLAGVAADGTAVALGADRVAPIAGSPDRFLLSAPRLEAEAPGGDRASIEAPEAEVETGAQRLRLWGGVRVEASGGYVLEAETAQADLLAGTLKAAPVAGSGPLGRIEAGALGLRRGEDGAARLVFNHGVRVLYQPGRPSEEAP